MPRNRLAARAAIVGQSVDDFADHRDHRNPLAALLGRIGRNPCVERDAVIFPRPRLVRSASNRCHPRLECHARSHPVDQPRRLRRRRQIVTIGPHRRRRIGDIGRECRAGPGALHLLLPLLPQHAGISEVGLFRLGRLVAPSERLDRALERADLIDIGGHPQPVHQPLVIKPRSARPSDQHAAALFGPYFGRMRRQLIGIVAIGRGIGQHRLVRRAHLVDGFRHIAQRHLPAAHEAVEIEHNDFDAIVGCRDFQCAHQIGAAEFACRYPAGEGRERIDRRRLLADRPVELQHQRPRAEHRRRIGPAREYPRQQHEEQQQKQQRQHILDTHQHPPDAPQHLPRGIAFDRADLSGWCREGSGRGEGAIGHTVLLVPNSGSVNVAFSRSRRNRPVPISPRAAKNMLPPARHSP